MALFQRSGFLNAYLGMPARRWYSRGSYHGVPAGPGFLLTPQFSQLNIEHICINSTSISLTCVSFLPFSISDAIWAPPRFAIKIRAGGRGGGGRRRRGKKGGAANEPKDIVDARAHLAAQSAMKATNAAPVNIARDTVIFTCERKRIFQLMSVTAVSQFTFWVRNGSCVVHVYIIFYIYIYT